MLKSLLLDKVKKFVIDWLKDNARELVMQLLDEFLKKLAQEQGAPAGAAHLTGPEVERAKAAVLDHFFS